MSIVIQMPFLKNYVLYNKYYCKYASDMFIIKRIEYGFLRTAGIGEDLVGSREFD
jgi:hypothetical protein